jgi:prophage maintenance system killer protein
MFLMLNGHQLEVPADDAVSTMLAVASGECDEAGMALRLADRIEHAQ